MPVVLILAALIVLLIIWGIVEQHLLLTRQRTIFIEGLPPAFDGCTILHITDLHHRQLGKNHARLVRKSQKLSPDFITITGDIVSRDETNLAPTAALLQGLRAVAPVYLSDGNHEITLSSRVKKELWRIVQAENCCRLKNETVSIRRGMDEIFFAGLSLPLGVYQKNGAYRDLDDVSPEDVAAALGEKRGITILLAHNPLFFESYAAYGAELVLSGHLHGGLVRLPIVGGILSPERKFFPHYSKGVFERGKTQMEVSGGIGKLRLFNPPEITYLTLKSK